MLLPTHFISARPSPPCSSSSKSQALSWFTRNRPSWSSWSESSLRPSVDIERQLGDCPSPGVSTPGLVRSAIDRLAPGHCFAPISPQCRCRQHYATRGAHTPRSASTLTRACPSPAKHAIRKVEQRGRWRWSPINARDRKLGWREDEVWQLELATVILSEWVS